MDEFEEWLRNVYRKGNGKPLSESSVSKYSNAVTEVSNQMLLTKTIDKPLSKMTVSELDIAYHTIFTGPFLVQDKKGNKMYSNAVKHYRSFKHLTSYDEIKDILDDIKTVEEDKTLTKTEKEIITKARIGQGKYRKDLIKRYGGKCLITKISIEKTLIASHIKPWKICTNKERIDPFNGLLLTATFDKLFDGGFISFKDNGDLIVSSLISGKEKTKLNIYGHQKFDIKYDPKMKSYLEYHRKMILLP